MKRYVYDCGQPKSEKSHISHSKHNEHTANTFVENRSKWRRQWTDPTTEKKTGKKRSKIWIWESVAVNYKNSEN